MSDAWVGVVAVLVGTVVGGAVSIITAWAGSRHEDHRAHVEVRTRREESFRRVQWAETLANDPSDRRAAAGMRLLLDLASSDLATGDDATLIFDVVPSTAKDPLNAHVDDPVEQVAVEQVVRDDGTWQPEEGDP